MSGEIGSNPVPAFRKRLPRLPPVRALQVLSGGGLQGEGAAGVHRGETPARAAASL